MKHFIIEMSGRKLSLECLHLYLKRIDAGEIKTWLYQKTMQNAKSARKNSSFWKKIIKTIQTIFFLPIFCTLSFVKHKQKTAFGFLIKCLGQKVFIF